MYRLLNGHLYSILEVVTPNQSAIVTTTLHSVKGYDLDVPVDIETMPEKNEPAGKVGELHYIDGQLMWVYVDKPPTTEEQIITLKKQLSAAEQAAADNSLSTQQLTELLIDLGVI